MPLVTVTLGTGRDAGYKDAILAGVHEALVASGVPEKDCFQRILELAAADFRYDARYPDLTIDRGDDFVLIEILWSVGRNVKIKRKLASDIVEALARAPGIDRERVMVVIKETAWENWSFGGGRLLHA
jgi:phenylpyruvate tautomerase PptA (4-oxalocrotonate tautomerase family)